MTGDWQHYVDDLERRRTRAEIRKIDARRRARRRQEFYERFRANLPLVALVAFAIAGVAAAIWLAR